MLNLISKNYLVHKYLDTSTLQKILDTSLRFIFFEYNSIRAKNTTQDIMRNTVRYTYAIYENLSEFLNTNKCLFCQMQVTNIFESG